jgi:pimeloyl-ACP methyl ester carboxylesterase
MGENREVVSLLYLHGVGNGDPRDAWRRALDSSLRAAGYPGLDEVEVIAPKYPDVLRTDDGDKTIKIPPVTAPRLSAADQRDVRRRVERATAELESILGEPVPASPVGVTDSLAPIVLRVLRQAHNYVTKPGIRARTLRMVLEELPEEGEIVIVGHSLGATFAVDALARALDLDRALATHRAKICLVTVGATIPKCALHPAAHRLRERIAKVVAEPSVLWAEYQAREDAISFYRFDPVSLTRVGGKADRLDSKPIIRRINVKNLLSPEIYKRFRLRVLRLHYQFVSANDIRAVYDYFMMICGPVFATAWTTSRLGFLDFFPAPDDSTVEP